MAPACVSIADRLTHAPGPDPAHAEVRGSLAKSAWWAQHWDHHARIIFDEQYGPFRACNSAGHLAATRRSG
ncbi:DUF4913 domain-containing protein [Curtobacterium flaccumfaciens]|uniref:DUF4913 domain-containing protein n=1 Tax=Curtobacterium flaccumfaciens TaxID=2035 RepID=UPI001BDE7B3C|nr:DUF4913 domain-containing protein [Curtobacterium flaccumfaciens pv. betae]MBT1658493.1 DUF4913 domain-containing protein [Curtobacterium flaccumfaciens pv. betae]